jgi:hypothetical protein
MLSFLQIRPASMKLRDVAQFIRVYDQKLISMPAKRQPPGDVLFGHFWQELPEGCGFQGWAPIAEDVRDIRRAPRHSRKRTFEYLLKRIKAALELKREAWNLAAVQRQLKNVDGNTLTALPAHLQPAGAGEDDLGPQTSTGCPQMERTKPRPPPLQAAAWKTAPQTP